MMVDRLFVPARSDIWLADFDHLELVANGQIAKDNVGREIYTRLREHGGMRPCVILSRNEFSRSESELVIVVPIIKQFKRISTHVAIVPPEGGLRVPIFAICEGIRSIGRQFLLARWSQIEDATLREIESELKKLMNFRN